MKRIGIEVTEPVKASVVWEYDLDFVLHAKRLALQIPDLYPTARLVTPEQVLIHLSAEIAWIIYTEGLTTAGAMYRIQKKYGCSLDGGCGLILLYVGDMPHRGTVQGQLMKAERMEAIYA